MKRSRILTFTLIFSLCGSIAIAECPFKTHANQLQAAAEYLQKFSQLKSIDPSIDYDAPTPEMKQTFVTSDQNKNKAAEVRTRALLKKGEPGLQPWFPFMVAERERLMANPFLLSLKKTGFMQVTLAGPGDDCTDGVCTSGAMVIHVARKFGVRTFRLMGQDDQVYLTSVLGHEIGHIVLNQVAYDEMPVHNLKNYIDVLNSQNQDWVEMIADGVASVLTEIPFKDTIRLMKRDTGGGDGDIRDRLACYENFPDNDQ